MNTVFGLRAAFAIFALLVTFAAGARGQNDLRRSTIAITYPLDQTIEGTTLAKLSAAAAGSSIPKSTSPRRYRLSR